MMSQLPPQTRNCTAILHDLILRQAASSISVHGIASSRSLVFDKAEAKWSSTILVTRELLNSSIGILSGVESDDSGTSGSAVWFILDFGLLNLANGGEQLNQILIAC
jgi:hypothetical protein